MPFIPPPIIPIPVPDEPAEPTVPLPEIGATVLYTLSAADLDLIATQRDPEIPLDDLAEGTERPGTVTETSGGGLITLQVFLDSEGTLSFLALLRPEGTGPGTWARPTT
ncbi:hypothetical protein ACWGDX_03120 [Streptomyces sp. NPDC055025]